MKVCIVAFDKFTDIDVFLAWDLFNRARFRSDSWVVKIVGTNATHRSVCGIELPIQGDVSECNDADVVFFASGPGTRVLMKDKVFLDKFQLNPDRQIICSICSGALILAALGLLDGMTATTYPTAYKELRKFGIEVVEGSHLVTHGNIATAAGCLAAVDLVGWCIEKMLGEKAKDDVIASVLPVGQGLACIY